MSHEPLNPVCPVIKQPLFTPYIPAKSLDLPGFPFRFILQKFVEL